MRALVQRVSRAQVTVEGTVTGAIGPGLLVLLGVTHTDTEADADRLAEKVRNLRVFADADGRMNEPLGDREVLCVSQFTLYGDTRKGNRPAYVDAARPEIAEPLYERFCERLDAQRGVFGAHMDVELVNDGPVTLMIEVPAARVPAHADLPLRRRAAAGRAAAGGDPSGRVPRRLPAGRDRGGRSRPRHRRRDPLVPRPHLVRAAPTSPRPPAPTPASSCSATCPSRPATSRASSTPGPTTRADVADDHPEWRMDISQEVIGGWRGERGQVAAMTLIWGVPFERRGRIVTAELGRDRRRRDRDRRRPLHAARPRRLRRRVPRHRASRTAPGTSWCASRSTRTRSE